MDLQAAAERAAVLAASWGVPRLEIVPTIGSSNDAARALAEAGAPHGTTVLADRQTGGRGRGGRAWHSPPGVGVWLSVLLRPASVCASLLSLRAGLAVARALAPHAAPADLKLKWPNDLWIEDRKVGGLLCESAWEGDGPRFVVVGVGVNTLQAESDFPTELRGIATSLAAASGRLPSRLEVAGAVATALAGLVGLEKPRLEAEELRELTARDALRGRRVEVEEDGDVRAATVLGVGATGALQLRDGLGRLREVGSGSVRLPAPAAG